MNIYEQPPDPLKRWKEKTGKDWVFGPLPTKEDITKFFDEIRASEWFKQIEDGKQEGREDTTPK